MSKNIPDKLKDIPNIEQYEIDWDYEHNVSICERSKTVIEPIISEEFFLSYSNPTSNNSKSLQQLGLEGVSKTNFFSSDYEEMAVNYLENIKDWCISRDLVWGHRFPVWYNLDLNIDQKFYYPNVKTAQITLDQDQFMSKSVESDYVIRNIQKNDSGVCFEIDTDQLFKVQPTEPKSKGNWIQEKKILDTWFSSSLWPLSTLSYYDANKKVEGVVFDLGGVVFDEGNGEVIQKTKEFINQLTEAEIDCYYITNSGEDTLSQRSDKEVFTNFKGGLSSFQSDYKKPEKEFYNEFLEMYGLDPKKLILIEDSEDNLDGAKKLGFNGIFFDDETNLSQEFLNTISSFKTDFDTYYPTQTMTTAKEIFYLWVVRMITLGMYFAGEIPFENVVITPTVLDDKGKKMSKSLGNGLKPEDAIDSFSSDSLRLGMMSGMIPNRNMKFGGTLANNIMERYRNFGNKIWNIARFLEYKKIDGTTVNHNEVLEDLTSHNILSPASEWVLFEYLELKKDLKANLPNFELGQNIDGLVKFAWDSFADWYVEYLKTDESQLEFAYVLFRDYIMLLSPYLPFETEVLWSEYFGEESVLAHEVMDNSSLNKIDLSDRLEFVTVIDFISSIRSSRGLFGIEGGTEIEVNTDVEMLFKYEEYIKMTCKTILIKGIDATKYQITKQTYNYSIDIQKYLKDTDKELERTNKEILSLEKQIESLEKQLGNTKFIENAEKEVIEEKKADLVAREEDLKNQVAKIKWLN